MIGYNKRLYVLPFDHKTGLFKMLYGASAEPSIEQVEEIKKIKWTIYQGFKKALDMGMEKSLSALLVDETFGEEILIDAKKNDFVFALNVEKSGQKELDFEYGDKWQEHIEKFDPPIVKILVRYNPGEDAEMNKRQLDKIKLVSSYCRHHDKKLMIEPLLPATEEQLTSVGGDKKRYDKELRPSLTVDMIRSMQQAGIEADIWKIEGFDSNDDYKKVVMQATDPIESRSEVGIVVLGRGESTEKVFEWIDAAADVSHNIIGFAVGRTAWKEAIFEHREGKITEEEAVEKIAINFYNLYKFFNKSQLQ